jgi:hypothetical protein
MKYYNTFTILAIIEIIIIKSKFSKENNHLVESSKKLNFKVPKFMDHLKQ